MSNKSQVKSLVALAEEIIAAGTDSEIITLIEQYADSFNQWYLSYKNSTAETEKELRSELESLLLRHEKVLEISEKLKDLVPDQIAKLKNKGRGIIAYTDTLPKKISFTKTTKG